MNKHFIVIITAIVLLQACSSPKTYESTVFPDADAPWLPVNPEHFGKTEAQRIYEGNFIQ